MQDVKMTPFILVSSMVHLMAIVLFYLMAKHGFFFLSEQSVQLIGKSQNAAMEAAVRIDVVAMPKMTLRELRVLEDSSVGDLLSAEAEDAKAKTPQAQIPKAEDDSLVFHKQEKKMTFASILEKYGQQELKKEPDAKKPKAKTADKGMSGELKKLINEGNVLAKGTRLTGGGSAGDVAEFNAYLSGLPDAVRPYWKLPSYLMDRRLKCRIRVYLRHDGTLIRATIFESSGVEEYDQRALDAVLKTNPYPPVPRDIRDRVLRGEILLGFPL